MDKLVKIAENYDFNIRMVTKRVGDVGQYRVFDERFVWKAIQRKAGDELESRWEGFKTAEECVANLIAVLCRTPVGPAVEPEEAYLDTAKAQEISVAVYEALELDDKQVCSAHDGEMGEDTKEVWMLTSVSGNPLYGRFGLCITDDVCVGQAAGATVKGCGSYIADEIRRRYPDDNWAGIACKVFLQEQPNHQPKRILVRFGVVTKDQLGGPDPA